MLALRLALSQELINRAVKSRQFLFLDEPFAFFDDERTRSSMAVLPRLSDDITQIWVIAQKFPEDVRFERRIQCERESDSCVSAGQAPGKDKNARIAPGELRSNERLGQGPKTGAQAKQGQRSAGRLRIQGAPRGAYSLYVTLGATPKTEP